MKSARIEDVFNEDLKRNKEEEEHNRNLSEWTIGRPSLELVREIRYGEERRGRRKEKKEKKRREIMNP